MHTIYQTNPLTILKIDESEMPYTIEDLMQMSTVQLNTVFQQAELGDIPNGKAKGTAIIAPGTLITKPIADIINEFAWQGKTFDAASDTLVNRITFFGISAIQAEIYVRPSLFDGNDCIVLDYSENSTIVHWVRDEIRLIGPQMYLGIVYWKEEQTIYFALEFGESSK
jgi:hypothetical protein